MRFSTFGIVALGVACVPQVWAETSTDSVSAPTCGVSKYLRAYYILAKADKITRQLTCIVSAIVQNSTCELLDTPCICSSVSLNEAAALCIAESCSVRDQLGRFKMRGLLLM